MAKHKALQCHRLWGYGQKRCATLAPRNASQQSHAPQIPGATTTYMETWDSNQDAEKQRHKTRLLLLVFALPPPFPNQMHALTTPSPTLHNRRVHRGCRRRCRCRRLNLKHARPPLMSIASMAQPATCCLARTGGSECARLALIVGSTVWALC